MIGRVLQVIILKSIIPNLMFILDHQRIKMLNLQQVKIYLSKIHRIKKIQLKEEDSRIYDIFASLFVN